MKKYKHSDIPSLIQQDRDLWDARCFRCKRGGAMDFHHILNGSKYSRQVSEEIGAWVWLCPSCHRWVHSTGDGMKYQRHLKALVQEVYEQDHTREEWMWLAHKNYREDNNEH